MLIDIRTTGSINNKTAHITAIAIKDNILTGWLTLLKADKHWERTISSIRTANEYSQLIGEPVSWCIV